jgi:hypothetical protein
MRCSRKETDNVRSPGVLGLERGANQDKAVRTWSAEAHLLALANVETHNAVDY